jgi:hypothetical protein
MRDKIIFNNTLIGYEEPREGYGNNIDLYYHEMGIENEKEIFKLKHSHYKILDRMVDFFNNCDSPSFCSKIIGQSSFIEKDS